MSAGWTVAAPCRLSPFNVLARHRLRQSPRTLTTGSPYNGAPTAAMGTAKLSHGAPDGPGPAASPSDGATAVAAAVYAAAAVSPRRPLFSVAPMMDWTEVNFRQLCRLLSKHTWLWTEMVVDKTVIHTDNLDRHLWFPPEQRPLVCQLGGSDPADLGRAAAVVARYGYDEINLNCGCPSDRVAGAGCFGATLMTRPQVVADCTAAVAAAAPGTPVTVKCRLGVDDADSYEQLHAFVKTVSEGAPVRHFIIHSRIAYLDGLNPHQNRTVPPLRYEWVWALKRDFPHLHFSLNGGIQTVWEAAAAIRHEVDGAPGGIAGVMVGRAAWNDPWGTLASADVAVFGAAENVAKSRRQVLRDYARYGDGMLGRYGRRADGTPSPSVRNLATPLLNLFHGQPGNKKWKHTMDRLLLEGRKHSVSDLVEEAMGAVSDAVLDAPPAAAPPPDTPPPGFALEAPLPQPGDRAGLQGRPPRKRAAGGQAIKQSQRAIGAAVVVGGDNGSDDGLVADSSVLLQDAAPAAADQNAAKSSAVFSGA